MDKRLYVLINSELTSGQRIPQACHAVAEFMAEYGQDPEVENWVHKDKTMVCLKANEEKMLETIDRYLEESSECRNEHSEFRNDDLGNMLTAVAFYPMTKKEGNRYFKKLKLA